jgi:hypothetical protein
LSSPTISFLDAHFRISALSKQFIGGTSRDIKANLPNA